MELTFLSRIIGFIIALTVHEFSHAFIAYKLGDSTAKYKGRLSINPIKHIDPFGTILLPLTMIIVFQAPFVFGYAKPVPVNPYNLRGKYGDTWVSLAGPLSNFIVAFLTILFLKLVPEPIYAGWSNEFIRLFLIIAVTNIAIGLFNLIPVHPLDGSKVLISILPPSMNKVKEIINNYGYIVLFFVFIFGSSFLSYAVFSIMTLMYGGSEWTSFFTSIS